MPSGVEVQVLSSVPKKIETYVSIFFGCHGLEPLRNFLQKIRRLLSMELTAAYNYPTIPLSMGMNLQFVPGLILPKKLDYLPYFQAAIIIRIMVTS